MTTAALTALITLGLTALGAFIMVLMVNYLPESPIQNFISGAGSFWAFCNGLAWFIPIDRMFAVLEVWVVVMWSIVVFKVVYELVNKIIE